MPKTYEPISTQTVGTATPSVTFSSIPQTYTDLVIVSSSMVSTGNGQGINLRFNSDTGSNYSHTVLYGTGISAVSGRTSSATYISYTNVSDVTNNWDAGICHIMNYANSTTNKTTISRGGVANQLTVLYTGLWRSTAAITNIVVLSTSGNIIAGSTFTLYGIKAA
jgi:hypothetical protein